jgi:16S rRNA (cytosine967-C5)-methyltransferase
MLAGVAPMVAPAGVLVAITCSLEPEENEHVVARFLARHDEFALAALAGSVPAALERFIVGDGFWRVLTGGDHDGFTVHVLRRGA